MTNFPGSVRYPSRFRQLGTLTLPERGLGETRAPSGLPKAVEERNRMFWAPNRKRGIVGSQQPFDREFSVRKKAPFLNAVIRIR